MTESPFAPARCYLLSSRVEHDLDQHYPILIAHTGSCAKAGSSVNLRCCNHSIIFRPPSLLPPRSFPPLDIHSGRQGGRGVYIRAERGSLPSRASDMLAVRNRAIDGRGLSPPRSAALLAAPTRIAPRPPHRSRRALLTHRALIEGQTRSAFGVLGTHTAAIRGPAASVTCHIRRCVRGMRCCLPFLRSAAFPPPFRRRCHSALFEASSVLCSRPTPHVLLAGYARWSFPDRPATAIAAAGDMRPPRFRTKDVSTCMGLPTARGSSPASHLRGEDVAFSSVN
jgi:hypothetical protein